MVLLEDFRQSRNIVDRANSSTKNYGGDERSVGGWATAWNSTEHETKQDSALQAAECMVFLNRFIQE